MNALLAPTRIAFEVLGVPEPQGSYRAFIVHGRAVVTTDNRDLKAWRKTVALAYQHIVDGPITCPVVVRAVFRFERPPSAPKSRLYPVGREGDADKLCRGLLDALSQPAKLLQREGGGETRPLLRDDGLVVDIVASKRYAGPGQQPGVHVEIEMLPGRA